MSYTSDDACVVFFITASYLLCLTQNTHWLTAEECILAADFQNSHPNPCKLASNGFFGSKFVTVCVSGNESNQVDTSGYQVCHSSTCHHGMVLLLVDQEFFVQYCAIQEWCTIFAYLVSAVLTLQNFVMVNSYDSFGFLCIGFCCVLQ